MDADTRLERPRNRPRRNWRLIRPGFPEGADVDRLGTSWRRATNARGTPRKTRVRNRRRLGVYYPCISNTPEAPRPTRKMFQGRTRGARRRRPPPIVESEALNDCKIGQTSLDARRAPSRTHRRNHPHRFLRHHRSTAPSRRRRVESPLRLRSRARPPPPRTRTPRVSTHPTVALARSTSTSTSTSTPPRNRSHTPLRARAPTPAPNSSTRSRLRRIEATRATASRLSARARTTRRASRASR